MDAYCAHGARETRGTHLTSTRGRRESSPPPSSREAAVTTCSVVNVKRAFSRAERGEQIMNSHTRMNSTQILVLYGYSSGNHHTPRAWASNSIVDTRTAYPLYVLACISIFIELSLSTHHTFSSNNARETMAQAFTSAFAPAAPNCCSRAGRARRTTSDCKPSVAAGAANDNGFETANDADDLDDDVKLTSRRVSRRGALRGALGATAALGIFMTSPTGSTKLAASAAAAVNPRAYFQRYPTLFAPFYGDDERATIIKEVVPGSVWALEQNLAIGPLETPLRCVVIKLGSGQLWVHAPLAPTEEFFTLIESLGAPVGHIVVGTYFLE